MIMLMLVSTFVFAGITTSSESSSDSSSSGSGSTSGMVELYDGQWVPEVYLDQGFYLEEDSRCSGSYPCWDVNSRNEVVYYENDRTTVPYYENQDLWVEGRDFVDVPGKGMSYEGMTSGDTILTSSDGKVLINVDNGNILIYDSNEGYYYEEESATINGGLSIENIQSIELVGAQLGEYESTNVENGFEAVITVKEGDETYVYVGEAKLKESDYNAYSSQFSTGVIVDGDEIFYGSGDTRGTLEFSYETLSTSLTHTTYDSSGATHQTTSTTYNDGTTTTKTGDQITVNYDGGTITGTYSSTGLITDGEGELVGYVVGSETDKTIIVGTYSNGDESEPSLTYEANFDDSGELESTQTQLYAGTGDTYQIIGDSGTYGDVQYDTEYSSKADPTDVSGSGGDPTYSAERTYYSKSTGDPIGIQTKEMAEQDDAMGSATGDIYVVIEEDGETYYGTTSIEKLEDGEVTVSDLTNKATKEELESATWCDTACSDQLSTLKSKQAWDNFGEGATDFLTSQSVGKFTGLSNLFYSAVGLEEWVRNVDAWFSRSVLNEDYIASRICYTQVARFQDISTDGIAVIENSYGTIQTVANVFAEMTHSDALLCIRSTDEDAEEEYYCPDGLYCEDNGFCYDEDTDEQAEGYFYKISWGVQAPADEAATPNIDENGFAVQYNVVVAGNYLYMDDYGNTYPLKLINGDSDGQVITWWSNNDYENKDVCIEWSDDTDIYTTGGSVGLGFSSGEDIGDVCNTIVYSEQTTVQMNAYGSAGSTTSYTSEDSTTSNDVSFNSDW